LSSFNLFKLFNDGMAQACLSPLVLRRFNPVGFSFFPLSRFSSNSKLPVLTLYTKVDCSLCDEALEKLQHLKNRFHLEEVDILLPENKQWHQKYRYDIPVFHFEGDFLMKHRANVPLLETNLLQFELEERNIVESS